MQFDRRARGTTGTHSDNSCDIREFHESDLPNNSPTCTKLPASSTFFAIPFSFSRYTIIAGRTLLPVKLLHRK